MATTVTKIVDPDGGAGHDYDSLSLWEAGEQGDLTGVRDEIAVAKCRCTGGTADTTEVTIDGWTTSPTQYIKIWTDPAESYRHNGTYQTGNKYRLEKSIASSRIIIIKEENVKFLGIQLKQTSGYYSAVLSTSATGASTITIDSCIVVAYSGNVGNGCMQLDAVSGSNIYVVNSILYDGIYDSDSCALIFGWDQSGSVYIYNCTIKNSYFGVTSSTGSITLKNCIFSGCTTDGSGTFSDTYCSTSNDNTKGLTAAGTGNRFSQTFSFVGAADFHLQSSDAGALGYGLNLYNDAAFAFQTDIDGQDRGGSGAQWDIGADEYVAAGGASTKTTRSNPLGVFSGMNFRGRI